jgi:hypothetical protein
MSSLKGLVGRNTPAYDAYAAMAKKEGFITAGYCLPNKLSFSLWTSPILRKGSDQLSLI